MFKKITLLILFISIILFGYAQKTKRKLNIHSPKSIYFNILIDGDSIPKGRYCPGDSIEFNFIDHTGSFSEVVHFTYSWHDSYNHHYYYDTSPVKYAFPIIDEYPNLSLFYVYFVAEIQTDTAIFTETISAEIKVDFIRTILEEHVCRGRDITITTNTHGDITYRDVQSDQFTPWDTLKSVSGCDSLVRWHVIMDPYIELNYDISSCDSVIWEHFVITRPDDYEGDYVFSVDSVYKTSDPVQSCDTLKILTVTIIDTAKLKIEFDKETFCAGDDMSGTINLETNFTAFEWTYRDSDSTFIVFEKNLDITEPGTYFVRAYMDTSLYDTLKNLRIVNCFLTDEILIEDCPLVIPNVITPNGDGANDVFAIKKLNLMRENELTIYDRWGKNIFHQKNYKCVYKNRDYLNSEEAFSGLSRGGQLLPEGTYYYAFKYASIPVKERKVYTGVITIIREKKL